jgi:hypothetical protein
MKINKSRKTEKNNSKSNKSQEEKNRKKIKISSSFGLLLFKVNFKLCLLLILIIDKLVSLV